MRNINLHLTFDIVHLWHDSVICLLIFLSVMDRRDVLWLNGAGYS